MDAAKTVQRQDMLDRLANGWKPREMREFATTVLRLADSIDQNWSGLNVRPIFRSPKSLNRIERNAFNLAAKADLISLQRQRRTDFIDGNVLSEPAWDMLLNLFMQYAGAAKMTTDSLAIAAKVSPDKACQTITALEALGYVSCSASIVNPDVTLIGLTKTGVLRMGQYLEQV
ncbi:MAG: hypothetical protein ABIT10_08955 [Alteraurantiacibacter sp.]